MYVDLEVWSRGPDVGDEKRPNVGGGRQRRRDSMITTMRSTLFVACSCLLPFLHFRFIWIIFLILIADF